MYPTTVPKSELDNLVDLAKRNAVKFECNENTKIFMRNFGGLKSQDCNNIVETMTKPLVVFDVEEEVVGNRTLTKVGGKTWIPVVLTFKNDDAQIAESLIGKQMQKQLDAGYNNLSDSHFNFEIEYVIHNAFEENFWVLEKCKIVSMMTDDDSIQVVCAYDNAKFDEKKIKEEDF